jgi:3-oxoadipate enol-lactonase
MAKGAAISRGLRKVLHAPTVDSVPEGRVVELPGRGSTFVVDVPGPPGAPVLVLLHALGCTGYLSWYPTLSRLATRHRVVILDQRWHGRGIRSERFSLEECADDVAALLDVLEIDRCIPVGYSMGGAVAQLVWQRHPERVEGLVLAATARNFRGTAKERLFFPAIGAVMKPLDRYSRGKVTRLAEALPLVPTTTANDPAWGLAQFRSTSAWTMPHVLDALGRFDSSTWIGDVDVPTAVVAMAKDRTIPVRRQHRLASCIEGAVTFEVDAGHAGLVLSAHLFRPALDAAVESVCRRALAARKGAGSGAEPAALPDPRLPEVGEGTVRRTRSAG